MKIGDRVFVHGYIDEIRKDTVIIRNAGGYFGTVPSEVITGELPSAQPEKRTEERAETHACDLIDRQAAIDALHMHLMYRMGTDSNKKRLDEWINNLPSAHPELNEWCHECKEYDTEKGCCPRWGQVIKTALEDAKPEPRWVSVSERLPEKDKEVLVCYDFKGHRFVLIGALYDDGKFYGYDDEYLTPEGRKYRKAVAWMPLPEPYKGEQE